MALPRERRDGAYILHERHPVLPMAGHGEVIFFIDIIPFAYSLVPYLAQIDRRRLSLTRKYFRAGSMGFSA